jgi:hypothetical protein
MKLFLLYQPSRFKVTSMLRHTLYTDILYVQCYILTLYISNSTFLYFTPPPSPGSDAYKRTHSDISVVSILCTPITILSTRITTHCTPITILSTPITTHSHTTREFRLQNTMCHPFQIALPTTPSKTVCYSSLLVPNVSRVYRTQMNIQECAAIRR